MSAPASHPVRCVLFDLDGTLLDSAPDLGGATNALRQAHGLPPLPAQLLRQHAGSGARGMLHAAFDRHPGDADYEHLKAQLLHRYEQRMSQLTRPFHGVTELIEHLGQHGLRWGVVTNKAARLSQPLAATMPWFASAATFISGDTTPHLKPHPASLLEALRRLQLPASQCIYVGDDQRDVQAGHAAGMRTVAVRWGYLSPDTPIEAWGSDHTIDHPLDLLKWLNLA